MSFNTLRSQISTLLGSVSGMQEFSGTPKLSFGGFPAGYVVPSDSSADYETTKENIRTYAFLARIFYETKDTGIASALDNLEAVVDTVLDTLDQEDLKAAASRTIGTNLPNGYTFINIYAHPSEWGEVTGEDLIYAEIRIQVRISRDVT